MRLTTFLSAGRERLGLVQDDVVIDVARAGAAQRGVTEDDLPGNLAGWLARNGHGATLVQDAQRHVAESSDAGRLREDGTVVAFAGLELPPLIAAPRKFICIGRNYADHIAEAGRPMPEVPVCFARFPDSLIGHGQSIRRPSASHHLDWEGELAVVIGRDCRPRTQDEALEAIGGYSIFNDVSLRDYQMRGVQWTAGKNFFATGGFGPWMVTADEVPDPQALDIDVRVNGQTVQHANTKDMIFDVTTLIQHIAEWTPLSAGDVIATGTPSGVGFVRDPPWFLLPGDVVEVEIERIGTLRNDVVDA
jgi:acylpyruvate hydrolase